MNLKKAFWYVLGAVVLVRFWLAWVIPMTGDEAYYVVWGKHLAGGYYDQPPMVGWILHLLLWVTDCKVFLRLPAILLSPFVAWGLRSLLRSLTGDKEKADLGALLFLLAPIHVLSVFITTDTPLIYFSFAALILLERAIRRRRNLDYFLAGLFISLGFLSKYFALLVPAVFSFYFLFSTRKKSLWKGLSLLKLGILPGLVFHLYWNYKNCWINFLFNLHSRSSHETSFTIDKFATFLGYQIYLMTPFLIFALYQRRREVARILKGNAHRFLVLYFLLPLAAFAISALKFGQGLHWMLAFYPAYYALVAIALPVKELRHQLKWMTGFLAIHLLAIMVLAALPNSFFKDKPFYNNLVLFKSPESVTAQLEPYKGSYHFSTDSYTLGAILSYSARADFSILGMGGRFGREDDLITDYRNLDRQNILFLSRLEKEGDAYKKFFLHSEIKKITASGIDYFLLLGRGFNYQKYRKQVLLPLQETYYQLPAGFPVGGCSFK